MNKINKLSMLNPNAWGGMLGELKIFIQESVKEGVLDAFYEMNIMKNVEDQRLTSEQLCQRWSIAQNTLRNWEKNGVIKPLPTGGRRKIYSMASIQDVENSGYLKRVS